MGKLKIASQIPISVLVKRILKRIVPSKKINYTLQELRNNSSKFTLKSLLNINELEGSYNEDIINHYLKHEFDLLGSGWVSRDLTTQLNLTSVHQPFFNNVSRLISDNYQLINWQLDVRSGFEFDPTLHFDKQKIDTKKYVDIKNCWELGRLQHLPQMAIEGVQTRSKQLILEFKNQILDFVGSNPIGMGVQWACTMDVGIRLCNLVLAYDLFKQIDDEHILDNEFQSIFSNSIYCHAQFIYLHLEHKEGAAGNHYLFNLIGLLFASNYLSNNDELNVWRDFAEKELEIEFHKQFFTDGGNFEGSTTYHCLSAEAMLYATALMLRNGKKINQKYIDLLYKTASFIKDVIKPNGEMPQFGDNDSGRLFKLSTKFSLLNYKTLSAGFSELFGSDSKTYIEQNIIEQLANNYKIKSSFNHIPVMKLHSVVSDLKHIEKTEINFSTVIDTLEIKQYAYPEFGIYIFKSDQFYLAVSAISNPKMHHSWGHVHNDKLSFDVQVNGIDLVKDPGTFSYSAYPMKRQEFRSTKAHHGIVVNGIEQNIMIDPFYLEREVKCKVLEINNLSITLQAKYYGVVHIRKFEILDQKLIITDSCNKPFKVNINEFELYSPNYGESQKRI